MVVVGSSTRTTKVVPAEGNQGMSGFVACPRMMSVIQGVAGGLLAALVIQILATYRLLCVARVATGSTTDALLPKNCLSPRAVENPHPVLHMINMIVEKPEDAHVLGVATQSSIIASNGVIEDFSRQGPTVERDGREVEIAG